MMNDICKDLKSKEVKSLILGYTELPIIFKDIKCDFKIYDPTDILAKKAVETALN